MRLSARFTLVAARIQGLRVDATIVGHDFFQADMDKVRVRRQVSARQVRSPRFLVVNTVKWEEING
jgi:hypothetical protein